MPSSGFLPIGPHGARLIEDFRTRDVHDEHVWRISPYSVIGDGSTYSVYLKTPAAAAHHDLHLKALVETNGPGVAILYEGPNATGDRQSLP